MTTVKIEGIRREPSRVLGYTAGGPGSRNWFHNARIYKKDKTRRVRLPHKSL